MAELKNREDAERFLRNLDPKEGFEMLIDELDESALVAAANKIHARAAEWEDEPEEDAPQP